jgi:hypothetical protein
MSRLQMSGSDSTGRDSSFTTSTSDGSHASHMSQTSPDLDSESLPVSATAPGRNEAQGAPKRANQQRSSYSIYSGQKVGGGSVVPESLLPASKKHKGGRK